jgi:hypothetical protein
MFLPVSGLGSDAGGVLCRRSRVGAAVAAEQRDNRGVRDPHLAAPLFAPRPARRGSLTPHMQVTIIRRDSAISVTLSSAPPCVGGGVHGSRVD